MGPFILGVAGALSLSILEIMKERHADISLCITDILIDGKSLEKMEEKQSVK